MSTFVAGLLIGISLGMVIVINGIIKPDMLEYAENNVSARYIVYKQFPDDYKARYTDWKQFEEGQK